MPKAPLHERMRLLLLCLTFACGSASGAELFQSLPTATLSANQVSARNHLSSEQGFKSITTILIDKAALNSNVITLTIKGRTYRIEGKLSQDPAYPVGDMTGKIWMAGAVTLVRSVSRLFWKRDVLG
jgi:hypothetical protein